MSDDERGESVYIGKRGCVWMCVIWRMMMVGGDGDIGVDGL